MTKNIHKIILLLFGFFVILSIISNTFDGDFGWHLRFGQDAWNNNFQYTDSYTWTYYGHEWVNHEWGGDIVFYWLNKNLGYFSLVIIISLAIWLAFVTAAKIFNKKLTPFSIVIILLAALSVKFIMMMRLSMLSPLFFVLVWWSLEKLPEKKTYYFWPLLLWLWSFFHGSWILGFITINIYLAGNIIQIILNRNDNKRLTNYTTAKPTNWTLKTIHNVIMWQIIAGLAIVINPYGWKMWSEVVRYFTASFYKMHINEWLPSYTYPVYWWPLAIAALAMVIIIMNWKKKIFTWPQILMFVAFFISAIQYKRNNFFLALICAPLLVAVWQKKDPFLSSLPEAGPPWTKKGSSLRSVLGGAPLRMTAIYAICLIYAIWFLPHLRVNQSVWQDRELLMKYSFPVDAVEFLKQKTNNETNVRFFNAYSWGGYLVWNLPNALLHLDGRSAATWFAPNGQSWLEKHIDTIIMPNKIKNLEKEQVKYIILEKKLLAYPKPNWINKLLFNKKDLDKLFSLGTMQIEKDLEKSKNWQLIYTDNISNVWENAKP